MCLSEGIAFCICSLINTMKWRTVLLWLLWCKKRSLKPKARGLYLSNQMPDSHLAMLCLSYRLNNHCHHWFWHKLLEQTLGETHNGFVRTRGQSTAKYFGKRVFSFLLFDFSYRKDGSTKGQVMDFESKCFESKIWKIFSRFNRCYDLQKKIKSITYWKRSKKGLNA